MGGFIFGVLVGYVIRWLIIDNPKWAQDIYNTIKEKISGPSE